MTPTLINLGFSGDWMAASSMRPIWLILFREIPI